MPENTDYLNKVTVIIRSVGERTEAVCRQLIIEQGVPPEAIFTINEAPFSKAMRVGFEIGLEQGRSWTFCVDADLLLRSESIEQMVGLAEKQPSNVCEVQSYILDKFFGGARMGGVHVYRTGLLDKVIANIPEEGVNIRPESHTLNSMAKNGYPWVSLPVLVGLHDFEQSYEDIFRKCFVQAHKHFHHANLFVPFWRKQVMHDPDYKVALAGFAAGIEHSADVRIDARAEYFQAGMRRLGIEAKEDMNPGEWNLDRVDMVIENWVEPAEYWEAFPAGMAGFEKGVTGRALALFKWNLRETNAIRSSLVVAGWFLERVGVRLKRRSVSRATS
jgi:hypothetical protein